MPRSPFSYSDPAPPHLYPLSLHDALPIFRRAATPPWTPLLPGSRYRSRRALTCSRSEEHTSELQSRGHLVCRLLLEKKKGEGFFLVTLRHADEHARVAARFAVSVHEVLSS